MYLCQASAQKGAFGAAPVRAYIEELLPDITEGRIEQGESALAEEDSVAHRAADAGSAGGRCSLRQPLPRRTRDAVFHRPAHGS
jgi:hypothetical protein